MNEKELREKFIKRRKQQKMSQAKAAEGMNQTTVSRYESGSDISVSNLLRALSNMKCELILIRR